MKYLIFFVGLSTALFSIKVSGQVNIYGKIFDAKKLPLPGITVSLYQVDSISPQMVGFSISDNDGRYIISIPVGFRKFIVRASSLNYHSQIDSFIWQDNQKTIEKIFILIESVSYLDTVKISAEFRFRQSGDTLTLNPHAFSLKNENNLEQLLERLPGVTVDDQGKIFFNGSPVTSVLIDGDDLFQNNYQQLTRNVSPDIVNKVDIIRNFQKDDNLKGYNINNGQVINIQLNEKYKHYIFGYAGAGIGTNNDKSIDLFLMKLSNLSKFQLKATYNNIGNVSFLNSQSVENGDLTLTKTNFFTYDPLQYKVEVNKYYDWIIPIAYQKINKTFELGANWLLKLPHKWDMLINCNVAEDSLYQKQQINTSYVNNLFTQRDNIRHEYSWAQKYGLDVTHLRNGSSFYFNLNYFRHDDADLVNTLQPPLIPAIQNLNGHDYRFVINANYDKKFEGGKLWMSTFNISRQVLQQNYYDNPDSLFWLTSYRDSSLYQLHSFFDNHTTQVKFKSSILFKKGSNIQSVDIHYYKDITPLESKLAVSNSSQVNVAEAGFINNNSVNSDKLGVSYMESKTFDGRNTFTINAQNTIGWIRTDSLGIRHGFTTYLPDYSLEYKYKISAYSFASLTGGFQKSSPYYEDLYGNYLLNGYRSIITGYPSFYTTSKRYIQILYSNMDLIKSQWTSFLFARMNFIDEEYIKNLYIYSEYTKNGYAYYRNKPKEIIGSYNSQKLLDKLSIKLIGKVGFNYKDATYLNGGSLFRSQVINLNAILGIKSSFKNVFNFDLTTSVQHSTNKAYSHDSVASNITSLNQKLVCYLVFSKNFHASTSFQHIDVFSSNHQQFNLGDISITKKFFLEKLVIGLTGRNLLNSRIISSNLVGPFYLETDIIYLRPREAFLFAQYHFK